MFGGFFGLVGMAQAKWRIENGLAKRRPHGIRFVGFGPEARLNELPVGELKNDIRQEVEKQQAQR